MTLTGTTTLSQSGPESNGNEGVLHLGVGALSPDGLWLYSENSIRQGLTPLQRCSQHFLTAPVY